MAFSINILPPYHIATNFFDEWIQWDKNQLQKSVTYTDCNSIASHWISLYVTIYTRLTLMSSLNNTVSYPIAITDLNLLVQINLR